MGKCSYCILNALLFLEDSMSTCFSYWVGSEATNRSAGQSISAGVYFVYLCVCNAQECKKYLIQCTGILIHSVQWVDILAADTIMQAVVNVWNSVAVQQLTYWHFPYRSLPPSPLCQRGWEPSTATSLSPPDSSGGKCTHHEAQEIPLRGTASI